MTNPTTPFGYAVAVSRGRCVFSVPLHRDGARLRGSKQCVTTTLVESWDLLDGAGNYVCGLPCRSLPMRLTPIDIMTWDVDFE